MESYTPSTHTIDSLGNETWGNYDEPFQDSKWGLVQGNTIAEDDFSLRYGMASNYPSDVFVTFNATTISGINIGLDGRSSDDGLRQLNHQNRNNDREASHGTDYTSILVTGCFGYETDDYESLLDELNDWNAYKGYEIDGYLEEGWFY